MNRKQRAYWQMPVSDNGKILGYVLFDSGREDGRVWFSSVNDPTLTVGENFWKRLRLSTEEIQILTDELADGGACWLVSPLRVGIISGMYDLWMGTLLYFHLHDDADAIRRLLYHRHVNFPGVKLPPLGGMRTINRPVSEDQSVLDRLELASACYGQMQHALLRKDASDNIALGTVTDFVEAVSTLLSCRSVVSVIKTEFADAICEVEHTTIAMTHKPITCQMEMPPQNDVKVRCCTPRVVELLMLYCLGILKTLSFDGTIDCEISYTEACDRDKLQISFKTFIKASALKAAEDGENFMLEFINQLIYRSDMNGVKFTLCAEKVMDNEETLWNDDEIYCAKITICPQKNPAKDPPPCLKTRQKLLN